MQQTTRLISRAVILVALLGAPLCIGMLKACQSDTGEVAASAQHDKDEGHKAG